MINGFPGYNRYDHNHSANDKFHTDETLLYFDIACVLHKRRSIQDALPMQYFVTEIRTMYHSEKVVIINDNYT